MLFSTAKKKVISLEKEKNKKKKKKRKKKEKENRIKRTRISSF